MSSSTEVRPVSEMNRAQLELRIAFYTATVVDKRKKHAADVAQWERDLDETVEEYKRRFQ